MAVLITRAVGNLSTGISRKQIVIGTEVGERSPIVVLEIAQLNVILLFPPKQLSVTDTPTGILNSVNVEKAQPTPRDQGRNAATSPIPTSGISTDDLTLAYEVLPVGVRVPLYLSL